MHTHGTLLLLTENASVKHLHLLLNWGRWSKITVAEIRALKSSIQTHVHVNHVSYSSCVTSGCHVVARHVTCCQLWYLSRPEVPLHGQAQTQQLFTHHGLAVRTELCDGRVLFGECVNTMYSDKILSCPTRSLLSLPLCVINTSAARRILFFSLLFPFPTALLNTSTSPCLIFTTGPRRDRPRKSLLTVPTDEVTASWVRASQKQQDIQCRRRVCQSCKLKAQQLESHVLAPSKEHQSPHSHRLVPEAHMVPRNDDWY